MASEDISPSDFASLDDYDKYLTKRLEELEKDKITLENRIKGRQVIEKLPSSAQEAEKKFIEVIERPGFKEVFCSRKDSTMDLLELGELVADISFSLGNIPISITALITIKIAKIGVKRFCDED